MNWFVVTSHNLSKAAWGEVQNRREQGLTLTIQHWELGVFISPSTLGCKTMGPLVHSTTGGGKPKGNNGTKKNRHALIPLPYKSSPEKYSPTDRAWVVDNLQGVF